MASQYGYDMSNFNPGNEFPDLDVSGALVTGNQLLAQALINRLFCDPGSYLQSPSFGLNIMRYLNATTRDFSTSTMENQITKECKKDPRVDKISCTVTFNQGNLEIDLNVIPVDGQNFSLSLIEASNQFQIYFQQAA
jgi:hypothetical protein